MLLLSVVSRICSVLFDALDDVYLGRSAFVDAMLIVSPCLLVCSLCFATQLALL